MKDILVSLESLLDTKLLKRIDDNNYIIDSINHFGFCVDYPEGITIYYHGEYFHL